jgi:hypothetical protein
MPRSRTQSNRQGVAVSLATPERAPRSWLLFVHQLPSTPSNLRVRTWRRLQQLGALAVKQAVYVLPDSPAAREDFEWLKTEIESSGGEASIFVAGSVDSWSDDALVEEFRRTRQDAYGELSEELDEFTRRLDTTRKKRGRRREPARQLEGFRQRFTALEHIDFFGSAGRDRVSQQLAALDAQLTPAAGVHQTGSGQKNLVEYRGRSWVTRPRPGVDRMSSAWLIRRFIDPEARFGFVADRTSAKSDELPFDMFGVEFTHRGDLCTFELLCEVFQLTDPALTRVAAVVHDLDLKDGRFGAAEAGTIGLLIEGLQQAHTDDHRLLEAGISLFDALYRAMAEASRQSGPRAVARPQHASPDPRKPSRGPARPRAARKAR